MGIGDYENIEIEVFLKENFNVVLERLRSITPHGSFKQRPHHHWNCAQQNLACMWIQDDQSYEVPFTNPLVFMECDRLLKHMCDWYRNCDSGSKASLKIHEQLHGLNIAHFADCMSALVRHNQQAFASTLGL